ncbi:MULTISPECIES: GGDEF domain-containing protein [Nocardiaceae]|uniref:Diguanylate cyclase (GGDEF)-like protein n=1 Tax=Rhodococcoides corynebacterioides TaxID=53972 RepID=A0ABS2KXP5_9NOCA|nr:MULTISPECIES: GGDEF domain-containing protein [Rhodococcus]MBM7416700.1 diguanylate cyclase (GGDEF)-like protein [Rhodococcus corynebacterioides]MBP1114953.1 diguanylate cyclase (GGDEF)-like protein [Rhodococcus sp. PvP016]
MNPGRGTEASTAMVFYLCPTAVLFIAGAVAFSGTTTGTVVMVLAACLQLAGAAVLHFGPRPTSPRTLGIVTGGAVASLCAMFLTSDGPVAYLLLSQAAMFLGMQLAGYWSERGGWVWVSVLTVGSVVAAALSPSTMPTVAYVLTALGIVAAAEFFGSHSRRMRHSASRDALTGLLNRQGLEDRVEKLLPVFASRGLPVSMAVLDLDNFKTVNDIYGHIAGDVLLERVSAAWRGQLRKGDVLGRLGGDEFVLFMPGTGEGEAATLLERLRAAHSAEWSVGLVCMPTVRKWSEIYRAADAELYKAKRSRGAQQMSTPVPRAVIEDTGVPAERR